MSFQMLIEKDILASTFITTLLGENPIRLVPLEGGNASLVYRADLRGDSAHVLKFSDNSTELRSEHYALKAWSEQGVKTPDIYQFTPLPSGLKGGVLHMEYVTGLNLFPLMESKVVDCSKVLQDLGTMLATMHQVSAKGYGAIEINADGRIEGKRQNFSETLESQESLDFIQANLRNGNLSERDLPLIDLATKLLEEQGATLGSCLIHSDFRAGNILYDASSAQPYTVIDPKATLSHPYLCLAYSLILEEIHGKNNPADLQQGYENITAIDHAALHAARFLKTLELLPRWGQHGSQYANALHKLFSQEKAWLLSNQ